MNIVNHCITFALSIGWSLGPAPCPGQKFWSNAPGSSVEWLTLGTDWCIIYYIIPGFFWWLQEINLVQASQYESNDEHDHLMMKFKLCQTWPCFKKINGSEVWALMTSGVALLPTNANLGQIMRIMEMNIWLMEPLFILYIQIFNVNICILVMSKLCLESQKWFRRALPLQVGISYILPYNQIIKWNNKIIKMNNQIFRITIA